MNKKFILRLLFSLLLLFLQTALAFNSDDVNKRLTSCIPSKDLNAGNSTLYQISGLTGSICIFKIDYTGIGNKPGLICKVPYAKMYEFTSYNPMTVQRVKNQYCVTNIKALGKVKKANF